MYVRMWTGGRVARTSLEFGSVSELRVLEVELRDEGVGPRDTLMRHSIPVRRMASADGSALKRSRRRDFSWMKRGWVSKSSDAKWISGRCPIAHFGVCIKRNGSGCASRENRTLYIL